MRELPHTSTSMYEYIITITTGIWKNAGTTASIAMQIYSSEESQVLYI